MANFPTIDLSRIYAAQGGQRNNMASTMAMMKFAREGQQMRAKSDIMGRTQPGRGRVDALMNAGLNKAANDQSAINARRGQHDIAQAQERRDHETSRAMQIGAAALSISDAKLDNGDRISELEARKLFGARSRDLVNRKVISQEEADQANELIQEPGSVWQVLDRFQNEAMQVIEAATQAGKARVDAARGIVSEDTADALVDKATAQAGERPMAVWDTRTNKPAFVSPAMVREAGGAYMPIPSGVKLESDGKGGLTFATGSMAAMGEGQGMPLGKSARGTMEKEVLGHDDVLIRLDKINTAYKPEYLTYSGQAKDVVANWLNKLDPDKRDQFSADRRAWVSQLKQYFLSYKKWATGAAAGEREMAEIEDSIPNVNDSPQAFESKMGALQSITRKLRVRAVRALREGIGTKGKVFKEWATINTLDSIPSAQERGDQLSLEITGPNAEEEILQRLREEGYD